MHRYKNNFNYLLGDLFALESFIYNFHVMGNKNLHEIRNYYENLHELHNYLNHFEYDYSNTTNEYTAIDMTLMLYFSKKQHPLINPLLRKSK